jgi:hypothetical protein
MDKIRAGWREQHWRSPRLDETLQPDRVKLVLPMVSLIPDEVDQALRVRFGDRFAKLDKTAVQAVVTAQVEGSVTNSRMQEITGEHSKDITSVLQSLVRDGLLTRQNQRRWASYRVAEDSPQSSDDSSHLPGDSPQSSPNWAGTPPNWNDWLACQPKFMAYCPLLSPRVRTRNCRWTNSRASFDSAVKGAGWQRLNWLRWWIAMLASCNHAF